MTPPDDRQGQYGVPYPGTGHDAFGAPGAGNGPSYGHPQYGEQQYGQPFAPQGQPYQQPAADPSYPRPSRREPVHQESEEDSGPLIRPFAMTGGRTRPRYELALEALVSSSIDQDRMATLLPEHQRICGLCAGEVKSVAEVSALLSLPLGVARILVADLAEAGLVAIHQPAAGGESGNQPDVTLLERVLSGLRKL
ncbi:DUF742 domain-containing protein [Kitasatospora azatica]|uniref:DUF742 domain-containing protein n=1 Tax=Kitasatospora azatica TaxID=58347 RepID=UPI00069087F0|nr:DUF742 domain-containing protein [Kitasatospora azatica]